MGAQGCLIPHLFLLYLNEVCTSTVYQPEKALQEWSKICSNRSVLGTVLSIKKIKLLQISRRKRVIQHKLWRGKNFDTPCPQTFRQMIWAFNSGVHPPTTSSCPTAHLSHRSFSPPQVDSFSSKDSPHPPCCSIWCYIVVALKSGHIFGDVIHAHSLLEMNLVHSLCNRQSTKNRRKWSVMWVAHFERKWRARLGKNGKRTGLRVRSPGFWLQFCLSIHWLTG